MSTLAFDTYAQVKHPVQTGVPEAQAEAFVNVVAGATVLPDVSQLATKVGLETLSLSTTSDIAALKTELKNDIAALKTELKNDIAAVKSELKNDIAAVESELKNDIAAVKNEIALVESNLRGEIKGLKGELIWWIVGCFGLNALIGLTAAIPQLLAHLPK